MIIGPSSSSLVKIGNVILVQSRLILLNALVGHREISLNDEPQAANGGCGVFTSNTGFFLDLR